MYDFDKLIDRSNTDAVKIEACSEMFDNADIIPMWVADMDFAVPTPITLTLRERVEHPIYGYTMRTTRFLQSIKRWQKKRNDWDVDARSIVWCPGVVTALSLTIQALTEKGDGIIIQPPVYPPFFDVIRKNGRIIEENRLKSEDGKWSIDFDEFEQLCQKSTTKAFILCHPHNPVGREWTTDELKKMGDICVRNNVIILSDEIHSDLMLNGRRHHPMATISDEIANQTITYMAGSKTFNIAGFATSYLIAKNNDLRQKYVDAQEALHLQSNLMGPIALQAAYENCEPWLNELQTYLSENVEYVIDAFKHELPEVVVTKPEATYLMWLDFSSLGISHDDLRYLLYRKAHVGMNDGRTFGESYSCRFRLNIASPMSVVEEAVQNIIKTLAPLRK